MPNSFVHLHLHSEYSLINSMVRLNDLVAQTLQNQMPAVAISDINNLYGAVKFFNKCVKQGIKPIIGAEIHLQNPEKSAQSTTLVLLVQNETGYVNLSELISRGFSEGQQTGKPIIQKDWLQEYADGLICLSGGLRGELGASLIANRSQHTSMLIEQYQQLFPDRFYIEIQRVGHPHEEEYIAGAARLAEQYQVPLVATNDVHFMQEADFDAHEVRVCINEGRVLNDPRRVHHHTPQQYYKTAEQMIELFADLPSAIDNTTLIAQRCNFQLNTGTYFLPDFPVPAGETIESHLAKESLAGLEVVLERRFPEGVSPAVREEYQQRMDFELKIINEMGFPGYFLIVADFIQWAKDNDIPVGPGRGSGAGSIVAYALKITDIDPIEHVLLFERFLNPERVSMPDFDVDFCVEGRLRVVDYVAQKYGRDKVSQIVTFGTLAAKAVIRDVGRVLDMPYGQVDSIAKLVPFDSLGMTLTKALAKEPELQVRYDSEEEVTALIDMSLKLEGLARNVGKHAGGVVIAPSSLTDFTPLYCEHGSEQIVAQYDKDDLEKIGLVKFDFLGLKTLTIIDWAMKTVNQNREAEDKPRLDIAKLPLDDAPTYELLKQGKTTAVFQLESPGMKELIQDLKPDQFADMIALVALYRPGPLKAGMEKIYCNRKHGKEPIRYLHPILERILDNTYGVILYQEQVMEIARVMAGYSLGDADILRRAISKKDDAIMEEQRIIFEQRTNSDEVSPNIAEDVFKQMAFFAEYGFNKSHSAAYGLIAYQTAWLKTHYAAEFMAACMTADMENTGKVVILLNEANEMGLAVQLPDINLCEYTFKATDAQHIVYGLGAIKGVGRPVIDNIIAARNTGGAFKDLYDLCERVDVKCVNRRALEALIRSGALDKLGVHRASLIASIDLARNAASQQHRSAAMGQSDMFGVSAPIEAVQSYQNVEKWRKEDLLLAEKETLGLYVSGHPIDDYIKELDQLSSCRLVNLDVRQGGEKKTVTLAGLVVDARVVSTKKGTRMALLTLDDKTARLDIKVYDELYEQRRDMIHKEKVLVIKGTVRHDSYKDDMNMVADDVFDIEQARNQLARHMQVKLDTRQMDASFANQLKTILVRDEEGVCKVQFKISSEVGSCRLDLLDGWRVIPDKIMMERLQELVGINNVRLIY